MSDNLNDLADAVRKYSGGSSGRGFVPRPGQYPPGVAVNRLPPPLPVSAHQRGYDATMGGMRAIAKVVSTAWVIAILLFVGWFVLMGLLCLIVPLLAR